MNRSALFLLLTGVSLGSAAARAQNGDTAQPSATVVPSSQYPRVTADSRVQFRVSAPNATTVLINPFNGNVEDTGYNGLGKEPYSMTKAADGSWTLTTQPIIAGFHYYTVLIDGASVDDPGSRTYFGAMRELSGVEVPEPGVDFYLIRNVPHGTVSSFWYQSKTTGQWEKVYVYLPPGYEAHPQQRYPALYLRHGGGENETGWIEQGHANFILDNLIAAGKAKPMILVMGSGYASPRGAIMNQTPAARAQSMSASATMAIDELIPEAESHYRIVPDKAHRAIAGLSMGAAQTLAIALNHLNDFSAVGAFSRPPSPDFNPQTAFNGVMADPSQFNKQLHVFWFGAGTAETGIFNSLKATRAAFDAAGIKYTYVEYPGLAHEWQIWRKQLNDFAPLLFQW